MQMQAKEVREAKTQLGRYLFKVNNYSNEELRKHIKDKFGISPVQDATEAEMRQTLMIWGLDLALPTK